MLLQILLQTIEVSDLTSLISIKELTVSGILIAIIYYFYKRTATLEAKIEEYIKQKDEDGRKYYDLVIQTNKILDETNRLLNENHKLIHRLESMFEKKFE